MSNSLKRYEHVVAFRDETMAFLAAQEAENNLILGVSAQILHKPLLGVTPYFASLWQDDQLVLTAIRTPPRNLLISTPAPGTSDETLDALLELLAIDLESIYWRELAGVSTEKSLAHRFAAIWQRRNPCTVSVNMLQRIYKLTQIIFPDVPGTLRAVTEADRALVMDWYGAFEDEALAGEPQREQLNLVVDNLLDPDYPREMYLWLVDDVPVSMAGFGGPTPNGMRVGPVYTPPEFRRKGYGAAVTAGVTDVILSRGRTFAFLYTDLDNPTSNAIYQKIGYKPIQDVDMLVFGYDD